MIKLVVLRQNRYLQLQMHNTIAKLRGCHLWKCYQIFLFFPAGKIFFFTLPCVFIVSSAYSTNGNECLIYTWDLIHFIDNKNEMGYWHAWQKWMRKSKLYGKIRPIRNAFQNCMVWLHYFSVWYLSNSTYFCNLAVLENSYRNGLIYSPFRINRLNLHELEF